jgi:hypothetical protein
MKRLTPIAASTAVLGGLLLTPIAGASAATTATYTCQTLSNSTHGQVTGVQNCQASPGAATQRSFSGPVTLRSRQYGFSFFCTSGGQADIPNTVLANGCTSR